MDKGDFDEVQEKSDEKNQEHDDSQYSCLTVFVGNASQKFPYDLIAAQTAKYQPEGGGTAQDDKNHTGQAGRGMHDLAQDRQVELFIGNRQYGRAYCTHGSGFGGRRNTGKYRSQHRNHQKQGREQGLADTCQKLAAADRCQFFF